MLEDEEEDARGRRAGREAAARARVGRMRMRRRGDDALIQMKRVMETAAAELRIERAREAVDAARAVAAEFELKAVGRQGEARGREVEEREGLRLLLLKRECCQAESKEGEEVVMYIDILISHRLCRLNVIIVILPEICDCR